MFPHRAINYKQTKDQCLPLYDCQKVNETHQTIYAIVFVLDCLLNVAAKFLLPKTLNITYRIWNKELTRKISL